MRVENKTYSDLLANYPARVAWKMIIEFMLRKIKREMDKKRFRVRGKFNLERNK
jgi:hypothetical protein